MHSANFSPPALPEDWRAGGFGVYVHWPFCAAKCPYCDFNSHVRAGIDQARWARAYARSVQDTARTVPGRRVDTVFFGGGTPSLMEPATVAAILEAIACAWELAPDAEITLEANPTSVEAGRFASYRAAGVNRVSMGIQALGDPDLRALGRMHTAADARAAFEIARRTFDRVSFDLIYARQHQSARDWAVELSAALDMAADHLSLYQLTIEPGTRFGDLAKRGQLRGLPPDESAADMYLATQEVCEAAGLPSYEISNHARPGSEGRHNLIYWRYGDYAGIGPGAHGRLTHDCVRIATEAVSSPEAWLEAVEAGRKAPPVSLSPDDQATEMLMMGLRLREGIDPARFKALAGVPLDAERVRELTEFGMLEQGGSWLRTTAQGRPLLDAILKRLLC